jgi:O-methyltransferase
LYSSTVTVLDFIKKFLVSGTVILFDDWYCFPPGKEMGERRAFNEFLKKYPEIQVDEWKNYSTFGKSFLVRKV